MIIAEKIELAVSGNKTWNAPFKKITTKKRSDFKENRNDSKLAKELYSKNENFKAVESALVKDSEAGKDL